MKRADVVRFARESKIIPCFLGAASAAHFKFIDAFAALVEAEALKSQQQAINAAVMEEREACADIVENANTPDCGGWTAQGIADAIRARPQLAPTTGGDDAKT